MFNTPIVDQVEEFDVSKEKWTIDRLFFADIGFTVRFQIRVGYYNGGRWSDDLRVSHGLNSGMT